MSGPDGRRVLVTGGGSGIGRATALRFARDGAAAVAVVDRLAERVERVAAEVAAAGARAVPVVADLASWTECTRAVEEGVAGLGGLDVYVSNAGLARTDPFLDITEESWQAVLSVNLSAGVAVGQAAAKAMIAGGGGGVILYTASIAALGGTADYASYNVSKAGVANLVRTMAIELAPHGIRVSCVSPGFVDTQFPVDILGEEAAAAARETFPCSLLGRLASADDIANAFAWLASPEAAYVTGTNLTVDGGTTAAPFAMRT